MIISLENAKNVHNSTKKKLTKREYFKGKQDFSQLFNNCKANCI